MQLPIAEPIAIASVADTASPGVNVSTLLGQVQVTDAYGGDITSHVDVDYKRNRLYFEEYANGNSLEGQTVTVKWTWYNATTAVGNTTT